PPPSSCGAVYRYSALAIARHALPPRTARSGAVKVHQMRTTHALLPATLGQTLADSAAPQPWDDPVRGAVDAAELPRRSTGHSQGIPRALTGHLEMVSLRGWPAVQ